MLRINIRSRKNIAIISACVLLLMTSAAYFLVIRDRGGNSLLTKEQIKENEDIAKNMARNDFKTSLNPALLVEVQSSLDAKKYADAKEQLDKLAATSGLTATDEVSIYSLMTDVCIKLKNLACADKVVAHQQKTKEYNYFFLVDMARIAKSAGQTQKAGEYFKIVLGDVDSKGGKTYLTKLTEATTPLDYDEIKSGATW